MSRESRSVSLTSRRGFLIQISYDGPKQKPPGALFGTNKSLSYETKPDEGRYNRKIRFALLNRNVCFAEAVDLIFHLHDAVSRALPHAIQVADRYHLLHNLRDHLQRLFDHKRTCLPLVEDSSPTRGQPSAPDTSGATPASEALVARPESAQAEGSDQPAEAVQLEQPGGHSATQVDLSCLTYAERKKQISREKRYARYEQVIALHRTGMGQRAIARELGVSRKFVRRCVSSPAFPERVPGTGQRAAGKSKLAPYLPYLRERWTRGTHNVAVKRDYL